MIGGIENWVIPLMAMVVPFIGALVVALFGRTEKTAGQIAVTFGLITAAFTVLLLLGIERGGTATFEWVAILNVGVGFNLDTLGVFVALVAGVIGFLVILYSVGYMKGTTAQGYKISRYYALVLLFIGAMIGLALTDNLLVLYIFWEVIGFCSFALIGYYYKDPKAMPAGTKAFIVTRIGDTGFLIAVLSLWLSTGTFNINEIITAIGLGTVSQTVLIVAGFGVLLGAIGKSALFPLHVWLPDAMEAPTPISALIHAATLVNAGVYLAARTYPMFAGVDTVLGSWPLWVAIIGSFTALITAIMAVVEEDLKRTLAYSTISQLGYMMAAVGFGAIAAAGFHLVSHAVFKALLFLCAGAIIHAAGTRNMYEMGGMRKGMTVTFWCFLIGSLALAGIPPLNGFWSKDLIMERAWEADAVTVVPLIFLVVTALLTAVYSIRMVNMVFFGPKRSPNKAHDPEISMKVPLVLLAFGALASWTAWDFFFPSMEANLLHAYNIHTIGLLEFAKDTVTHPLFVLPLFALFIFLLYGYMGANRREPFHKRWTTTRKGSGLWLVRKGFFFDDAYLGIVGGFKALGSKIRRTQTGDLNYNIMGAAIALFLLVVMLFALGGIF